MVFVVTKNVRSIPRTASAEDLREGLAMTGAKARSFYNALYGTTRSRALIPAEAEAKTLSCAVTRLRACPFKTDSETRLTSSASRRSPALHIARRTADSPTREKSGRDSFRGNRSGRQR